MVYLTKMAYTITIDPGDFSGPPTCSKAAGKIRELLKGKNISPEVGLRFETEDHSPWLIDDPLEIKPVSLKHAGELLELAALFQCYRYNRAHPVEKPHTLREGLQRFKDWENQIRYIQVRIPEAPPPASPTNQPRS
jgi:hypothetical protein